MTAPNDIKSRVGKVKGWFSDEQMDTLYPFLQSLPLAPLIVEIGTYRGRSTLFFALSRPGALVLTVDTARDFPVGQALSMRRGRRISRGVLEEGRVFQVIGESVDVAALFRWPIDFLFIDGDHNYEGVKADIAAWAGHVAPDGVVVFHDYGSETWPGVALAVDEWLDGESGFQIETVKARILIARRTG